MLPPRIRMAPTSAMARPKAARKAVSSEPRPSANIRPMLRRVDRPSRRARSEYSDLARLDGLSTLRSIGLMFALGRGSLLTAFLAAFGRAIAEVGAILIRGGNIAG